MSMGRRCHRRLRWLTHQIYSERVGIALLPFAITACVLIVLPGPDTAVVLRSIVRDGRPGAVRATVGVCCGLLVWLVAVAAGLSALLTASRVGYDILKIAGAVYLGWLGVTTIAQSLRRPRLLGATAGLPGAGSPGPAAAAATGPMRPLRRRAGFSAGLTADLLNPKVGVLFVTLLPQFAGHGHVLRAIVLLGVLYIAGTAIWFAILIQLTRFIDGWLRRPRTQRWLHRVTGIALIGFAAGLLAESRA